MGQSFRHKIKTLEELAAAIGKRPRAKSVVMCHGLFDIVHPGHLRHLMYAKEKADILIASLTADAHALKADHRPYVPQELRAHRPHPVPPARLLRQGLRILRRGDSRHDAGGDRDTRGVRRRDGVHPR